MRIELRDGRWWPRWSFAIIADVHSDINTLNSAVNQINQQQRVAFVIVLGDLIQGEVRTPAEYEQQFNAVKSGLGNLRQSIPYVPMLGNHDVWCNLSQGSIHLPDCRNIPKYDLGTDGRYPEEIFDDTFADQYSRLSTLQNWTKQGGMPINPNPYSNQYPPIYFQNFAFDCGSYHFVCLDFCSRRDFIPGYSNQLPGMPIFGYADLNFFPAVGPKGTFQWLYRHLHSLSPSQRRRTILFAHHPPVYKLNVGSIPLDGDATFAFTKDEYDQLASLLRNRMRNWFGGHYHLMGSEWDGNMMQWGDTAIRGRVSIIPSCTPYSKFDGFEIPEHTPVTVNGTYTGKAEPNPDGCLANVRVSNVRLIAVRVG